MDIKKLEHFTFLNELRNSGATNMWGATPILMNVFSLERKEASSILSEWMNNFEDIQKYIEDNNL